MKYAVPMSGGLVATHFGHCEQFALINVDEAKKQILNKEFVPSPGHEAEQGVSVVIAGGMGSRAQNLFQQNRIGVIIGAMGKDPEKTVLDYLNGMLATGDNICDH